MFWPALSAPLLPLPPTHTHKTPRECDYRRDLPAQNDLSAAQDTCLGDVAVPQGARDHRDKCFTPHGHGVLSGPPTLPPGKSVSHGASVQLHSKRKCQVRFARCDGFAATAARARRSSPLGSAHACHARGAVARPNICGPCGSRTIGRPRGRCGSMRVCVRAHAHASPRRRRFRTLHCAAAPMLSHNGRAAVLLRVRIIAPRVRIIANGTNNC